MTRVLALVALLALVTAGCLPAPGLVTDGPWQGCTVSSDGTSVDCPYRELARDAPDRLDVPPPTVDPAPEPDPDPPIGTPEPPTDPRPLPPPHPAPDPPSPPDCRRGPPFDPPGPPPWAPGPPPWAPGPPPCRA